MSFKLYRTLQKLKTIFFKIALLELKIFANKYLLWYNDKIESKHIKENKMSTDDMYNGPIFVAKEGYQVEVDWAEEGWDGDYDPADPQDEPLLRFWVSVNDTVISTGDFDYEIEDNEPDEQGYYAVRDSSYCTAVPANKDLAEQLANYLCTQIVGITNGADLRQECEMLSWTSPDKLTV